MRGPNQDFRDFLWLCIFVLIGLVIGFLWGAG